MPVAVKILAQGPFTPEQLSLIFTSTPPEMVPVGITADFIEERWKQYLSAARAQGCTLFDSPVIRLLRWDTNRGYLRLTLSPTSYKNFLVTTLRDREWFQCRNPEVISPVLGNSILLTYRGQVVLGIRSGRVSAYADYGHVIGGVFDVPPGIEWGSGVATNADSILKHLYREMNEELAVSACDLAASPRILGLFQDRFLAQPELLWHAELKDDPQAWLEQPADTEHKRLVLFTPGEKLSFPITPLAELGLALVFS